MSLADDLAQNPNEPTSYSFMGNSTPPMNTSPTSNGTAGELDGNNNRRMEEKMTDPQHELISYPIPIRNLMAALYLPLNLTQEEADRIKKYVDTLVTEKEKT